MPAAGGTAAGAGERGAPQPGVAEPGVTGTEALDAAATASGADPPSEAAAGERPTAKTSAKRGGDGGGTGRGGAGKRRPANRGRRLFQFDRSLGFRFVAGADEAGRGCLAGPLVAAAVLFDLERLRPADVRLLTTLNDSKQHTEEGREALYPRVLRVATAVHVVTRSAGGIDRRGLHRTNLAALRDALAGVAVPGCMCLSDGFSVGRDFPWETRAVVNGDATSAAIAAASIIAKVSRDRFMHGADAQHPGWGFADHVGYSTPEHREAIRRQGVSPLHRMSFQSAAYQQLTL